MDIWKNDIDISEDIFISPANISIKKCLETYGIEADIWKPDLDISAEGAQIDYLQDKSEEIGLRRDYKYQIYTGDLLHRISINSPWGLRILGLPMDLNTIS